MLSNCYRRSAAGRSDGLTPSRGFDLTTAWSSDLAAQREPGTGEFPQTVYSNAFDKQIFPPKNLPLYPYGKMLLKVHHYINEKFSKIAYL